MNVVLLLLFPFIGAVERRDKCGCDDDEALPFLPPTFFGIIIYPKLTIFPFEAISDSNFFLFISCIISFSKSKWLYASSSGKSDSLDRCSSGKHTDFGWWFCCYCYWSCFYLFGWETPSLGDEKKPRLSIREFACLVCWLDDIRLWIPLKESNVG